MKSKLVFLLVILFLSQAVQAKKVLLRFNLQKGATYTMTMNMTVGVDQAVMGQNVKIDQKMKLVLNWKVLDVTPEKHFLIEYAIENISLNMNSNGQNVTFDSDKPEENNLGTDALKNLKNLRFQAEMTDMGKVVKISGIENLASAIGGNQALAQSLQMFSNEQNMQSFFGQNFNYFPEKEVGKGDKWSASTNMASIMNMAVNMDFEVADIKDDQVLLNVNSVTKADTQVEQQGMKIQVKLDGTQTGTMTINPKDGWMDQSNLNQQFVINMKLKNPQSGEDMEIPMKMNATTQTSVVRK
jgi:hypothetical protein